jgi:alkanesulfonate monooxygenase SsuD/methylene tetrahydromethanopterin reductase-like flavin-dependent oxidoreductase (luciferase family)
MEFGLFDQIDANGRPLAQQLDERLELAAAADAAGLRAYHIAEHHATPLSVVPALGAMLGAMARETRRLRLGPLVYLLPLYSPLRLLEEIAVLDQLSHGRLDVGVGRGISPYELAYHNVDPAQAPAMFAESFEVLRRGLRDTRLDFEGAYYRYRDVPLVVRPLQQPHPPLWYASSTESGSRWAGSLGLDFCTLGPTAQAGRCVRAYREGRAAAPAAGRASPRIGVFRQLVIADDDAAALHIARSAYAQWYANLTTLERAHPAGPKVARSMLAGADDAIAEGTLIVGTPDGVRDRIGSQLEVLGVNYMVFGIAFGSMAHADALHTLRAFAGTVMPAFPAG